MPTGTETGAYDIATGAPSHVWDADATTARGARKLATALRNALSDAYRSAAELRGYRIMGNAIATSGTGAPIVETITDTGETVARAYYRDDAGATLERIAIYLDGRTCLRCADDATHAEIHDGARERITGIDGVLYARRLAWRTAHGINRKPSGNGRGSGPMFTRTNAEIETALVASLRKAIGTGPIAAFTVADETGARRAMSDVERDAVLTAHRVERVERAPMYAPLLDGMGDSLPSASTGHGTGHVAPYVPERDAPSLRRGTVRERLNANGAPSYVTHAVSRIWDVVNIPDSDGRYRTTAPWDDVRDAMGNDAPSSDTVRRHTVAFLNAVRERELTETELPLATAPPSRRLAVRRTGRTAQRTTAQGRTVSDGRGVSILAPSTTKGNAHAWRELPLWNGTSCACDVPTNGAHVETCDVRKARAQRVERWHGAPSRDIVEVNARERMA